MTVAPRPGPSPKWTAPWPWAFPWQEPAGAGARIGLGAALVANGLSPEHRAYLAADGLGFMLGDGRLDYAQERLFETYYAVSLGRIVTATLDAQRIWNPGYNRDRGPVDIYSLRLHAQF